MAIIYNKPAVILASGMVSVVSDSPSKMTEVELDHFICTRFSFFLSFLLLKCWLGQWNSSGLFFPSVHPQRYTASRWPFFRVEGSNKTPWQSCLLGAAEIMEDTMSCSLFVSFLDCQFLSRIKILNSCMTAGPGHCFPWRRELKFWRALRQ